MNRSMVRAFSMIELMIVILIIGLIVAILLPALGSVRDSSRDQATRSLMAELSNAISQFQLSEKRMPGIFTAQEMGSVENGNASGFLALDNAMLELAGGIVDPTYNGAVQIGPMSNAAQRVYFHEDGIGVSGTTSKSYFQPPAKYYKKLNGSENGTKQADAANRAVPSIVDAHGMPILLWSADQMAAGPITVAADFARPTSGAAQLARFYAASNDGVLNATSVGKKVIDQQSLSLLGTGNGANRSECIVGVLGAPGSPNNPALAVQQILPTAARGPFTLHAAGTNGVFVGRDERGGAIATSGTLRYGFNFKDAAGNPHLDSSGKPTSLDIMKDFDDILISGN